MSALGTALVVLLCVGTAAFGALVLGRRLPDHHVDQDSRDAVRSVTSFLSTLAALVLGLLIASAKSNFDARDDQLHRIAADVIALDRSLARYGEGAREARIVLQAALAAEVDRLSAGNRFSGRDLDLPVHDERLTGFHARLQALAPDTDSQRAARDRAIQLADGIITTRVLMTQDLTGSIPTPFLGVLVSWLTAMFASFALFTRPNPVVVVALLVGAASVSGAVFLILELDRPLEGIMRLSTDPLRHAVSVINS